MATRAVTERSHSRTAPQVEPEPGVESAGRDEPWSIPVRLGLLAVVAFLPAIACGWTDWDDDLNVLNNPHLRGHAWYEFGWAWRSRLFGLYEPLGRTMLHLEYAAFGVEPRGYHAVSLTLHAANAVALYAVGLALLKRAMPRVDPARLRRPVALAVSLWAAHPMRAEPVCWASCQNYLPAVLLSLLSLRAYLRAHEPGRISSAWWGASLALFASALMFKAVAVTLPAVLVVVDIYPLRRLGKGGGFAGWFGRDARRVWFEKLPFAAISLAYVGVLLGDKVTLEATAGSRLAAAAFAAWFYPVKTLAPWGLSAVYRPFDGIDIRQPFYLLCAAGAVGVTAGAWLGRRRWPGPAAAWACYLVTLAPNSGLVSTFRSVVADRYGYLSTAAFFVLLAGVFARRVARSAAPDRPLSLPARAGFGALLVLLCGLSWFQAATWRSTLTLWSHAAGHGGAASPVAQYNLARVLSDVGMIDEAIGHYRQAIALHSGEVKAHNNLGVLLARIGRHREALPHLAESVRLDPSHDRARNNLGLAHLQLGEVGAAEAEFRRLLRLRPGSPEGHNNLGVVLSRRGLRGEAAAEFAEALRLAPGFSDAARNLELARAGRGD